MKQTAVEQLLSNIRELAYDKKYHLGMGDIRITQGLLDELEEQAKEMEKQEKIDFADKYGTYLLQGGIMSAAAYNQTFKSE